MPRRILLLLLLVPSMSVLLAQSTSEIHNIGTPMNGMFSGSEIDSVQNNNGNLHVKIPLWSIPGRGVSTGAAFIYDSMGWHLDANCAPDANDPIASDNTFGYGEGDLECNYSVMPQPVNAMQMRIISSIAYGNANGSVTTVRATCHTSPPYSTVYSGYGFSDPNGTQHIVVPSQVVTNSNGQDTSCWRALDNGNFYAADGSGWSYSSGTPTSKSGIQAGWADTNGNSLTNGSSVLDTAGRTVTFDGSYYDENHNLQQLQVQTQQVSVSTHLCQSWLNSPCAEYSATWTLPHVITLPNQMQYTINYVQGDSAEISSIVLPTGATISYTYTTDAYNFGGNPVATRTVTVGSQTSVWHYSYARTPQWTVTVNDPNLNNAIYTCAAIYGNPLYDSTAFSPYPDSSNTPSCEIIKEQYYQGTGTLLKTIDYTRSDWPGLPLAVNTTWAATNQVSRVEFAYDSMNVVVFPDGSLGPSTAPITWGNVTEKREYDYGNGSPGPLTRITDTSYLHEDTTVNPNPNQATYLAKNIADRPTEVTVMDGSRNIFSQTKYYYDEGSLVSTASNQAFGHDYTNFGATNTIRGNLTRVSHWNNALGTWLDTKYTYNDLGELVSKIDPNGNPTSYDYSDKFDGGCSSAVSTNAYLTRVTDAAGHQTSTHYSYCTGLVKQIQDPNDLAAGRNGTLYSRDLMDNLTQINYPDGGQTNINYNGYSIPMNVATNILDGGTTSVLYDGLGRKSVVTNPDGATSEMTYDLNGNLASVTNFHLASGGQSDGTTSYAYDGLNRLTTTCDQDNGGNSLPCAPGQDYTQHAYAGNSDSFSDEKGASWIHTSDALGRLTQVLELGSSSAPVHLETDYVYNTLDDLVGVNQIGASGDVARSRSFTYDSLSRLLCSSNPETNTQTNGPTVSCPTQPGTYPMGVTAYTYDNVGNLHSKTDANGTVASYSYDALNRLTQESFSDGTRSKWYGYDGNDESGNPLPSPFNVGAIRRLSHSSDGIHIASNLGYDAVGRLTLKDDCLESDCSYTDNQVASYDRAGHLTSLTYPDGRIVNESWDSSGRLATVADVTPGGLGTIYFSGTNGGAAQYWPSGALMAAEYGDGVTQNIWLNSRLQPYHATASTALAGSPMNILDRQSFYSSSICANGSGSAGNNGNIFEIVDNLQPGLTQNFCYDGLNRVISGGRSDGAYSHAYGYDSFGNMIVRDNLAPSSSVIYNIDPSTNRLLRTHDGGATQDYVYDATGALTQSSDGIGSTHTYQHNAMGQLLSIDGGTDTYLYDGWDQRAFKQTASRTIDYVYFEGNLIAERDQNGSWTDYIYANGQKLARIAASQQVIHIHGNDCSTCNSDWVDTYFGPGVGYQIQNGDKLVFKQRQTGIYAGMYITTYQGGNTCCNIVDQNGDMSNISLVSDGLWHDRIVDLSSFAGQVVSAIGTSTAGTPPVGNIWDIYYADIAIVNANGSVTAIFDGQSGFGMSWWGAAGESDLSATVDSVTNDSASDGSFPSNHYYLEDHLGSTQMELSNSGWPVWSGQFTPFGQEIVNAQMQNNTLGPLNGDGTNMPYKFTGKERDSESGLDYFGARYFGSSMGRFMSPDWASKPETVPYSSLDNPQSLNLYEYVGNNPLSRADPDGHFWRELWNAIRTGCGCWTRDYDGAKGIAELKAHSDYMANEANAYRAAHERVSIGIVYPVALEGLAGAAGTAAAKAGEAEGAASEVEAVTFPENESRLGHIFRDADGHVLDTPENRELLQDVANDPAAKLGTDKYGNDWAARTLPDGRQAWTQTRGNTIVNAGINDTPRTFNPQTGLKAQ